MLVQLQAVLLEEQALIALTSTDLTQAKDIMIKLFALFSDNASLQKSEYASIHMLAGQSHQISPYQFGLSAF